MAASGNQTQATSPTITYRELRRGDRDAIDSLDDSFTTSEIYQVEILPNGLGFAISPKTLDEPINGNDSDSSDSSDSDSSSDGSSDYRPRRNAPNRPPNSHTIVATTEDKTICGVIELIYRNWNRRMVITDLIVAPDHRRKGIGKALVTRALAWGRDVHNAKRAWLEVSSINLPAINAYQKMGFTFCGLDASLYADLNEANPGIALYMSQELN